MDKGNLKINKHLFLRQDNVASAAHYLKRLFDSLHLSWLYVFMYVLCIIWAIAIDFFYDIDMVAVF